MIFVDTTFWAGDSDANDDFHESGHAAVEAIRLGRLPMALMTDFILDETVTILGRRKGFGAENAVKVADSLLSSPRVFTVHRDEALMKVGDEEIRSPRDTIARSRFRQNRGRETARRTFAVSAG